MKSQNKSVILSFIDWYRPGYKAGGTITAFGNFVDYLESDFEFKIITRDMDYLAATSYQMINSNSWNKLSRTSVYYLSNDNITFQKIKSLIEVTKHDIIYINGVFSLFFSIVPLFLARNKKCFVNPHGMLSEQAFSVKRNKKKFFLFVVNFLKLYKNTIFHVANPKEREDVCQRIKFFKEIRVSNQMPRKLLHEFKVKQKNNVVRYANVARISIEKGTLKMIKSFQGVTYPAILDIYGPVYDEAYWGLCLEAIALLPQNITVNYKGSVASETIPDVLEEYDFFVLLSEGENFGHAILEGLSAGCPVVISNKTPWQQLESKNIGWDLDIDNSQEITQVLNEIGAMSEEWYTAMSKAAFEYAKSFCENPNLIEQNKSLFL